MSPVRLLVCVACLLLACPAAAQEPLNVRIDQAIAAKAPGIPVAALSSDFEFVRRVYLDFAGRIPTAAETRAFLADQAPDKRVKLIDQLLAAPEYAERMSDALSVMLMERLGDNPEWRTFVRGSLAANKPWDQLVREIINANPDDPAVRGAAFFFTKRLENYGQNPVDLPALTRDVGRVFLGIDVQCAQCHDHLFIDEYKQEHFQGLFAFVGHTYIRSDVKFPAVGEKPLDKKLEFMSVFKKEPKATGPRLPGGEEVAILTFEKPEDAFAVPPDRAKNSPGVLKFSPLKILSEQLPRAENPLFVRNAVNRFWFLLIGRGLVHPLDLSHSGNPPSHPELLDLLAQEFVAHKFDIKWLLREIALSQAYQRSGLLPEGVTDSPPDKFVVALERPLSAEQMVNAVLVASGEWAAIQQASATAVANVPADQSKPQTELDKLRERFAKAFANPPREPELEFAPSVKAALFLLNDGTVLGWFDPKGGNLTERLAAIPDANQLAEELYVSVLSRLPDDAERAAVAAALAARSDNRAKGAGQLIWSLVASTEFCVNH